MGSAYQFHSWRVFVLVCAFPSVFAIGALTTQPESPRFFLEKNGFSTFPAYSSSVMARACWTKKLAPDSITAVCYICRPIWLFVLFAT